MSGEKGLRSKSDRMMARRMRNRHWEFMEKIRDLGKVWFCPWDKYGKHRNAPDNYVVDAPIGIGYLDWMSRHKDWFKKGRWNEACCAFSVQLTAAGFVALEHWTQYDMEPIHGGLVEPGWVCIPWPLVKPVKQAQS